MLKSLAIVSILSSAVLAQNSSTSAATSLIPSGISPACSTFLAALNIDATFNICLSSLSTATSAFAPGNSVTPSSASVTSALNNLCADSVATACPESLIRSKITDFYTACPAELTTSPVDAVVKIYDVLYAIPPMRTSVCSKDDSGSWCVLAPTTSTHDESTEVGSSGSTLGLPQLLALLYTDGSALKRRAATSAVVPNITTYHDTNLPFLFFTPSLDTTKLCTSCSRNVLTAYINYESNAPYAPGLSRSQLLSSQSDLYSAIQTKCPAGFLTGAVQAAGGLSGGILSSGAASIINSGYQVVLALALGATTLGFSLVL